MGQNQNLNMVQQQVSSLNTNSNNAASQKDLQLDTRGLNRRSNSQEQNTPQLHGLQQQKLSHKLDRPSSLQI